MKAVSPRRRRPVLVWVIFVWTVLSSGYALVSFWLVYVRAVPISPDAAVYLARLSPLHHAGTVLMLLLNLAGAVALVLLRKSALPLFALAFALNVALTLGNALTPGFSDALGGAGAIGLAIGFVIGISVCLYAWRLRSLGILV